MVDRRATIVIYDVHKTRQRNKIIQACLDKGMERIQFSAFRGFLTHSERKELFRLLSSFLEETEGRLFVLPLCSADWALSQSLEKGGGVMALPKPEKKTIFFHG